VFNGLYLKTEESAFWQATLISVISGTVKADLCRSGHRRRKILVNPNAPDLDSYARLRPMTKRQLRGALGFRDDDCVIGFHGRLDGGTASTQRAGGGPASDLRRGAGRRSSC